MSEKLDVKKVFIAGGTGFLGYYSTLEFLKKGVGVGTISLPDIPLGSWFPKEATVEYGNLFKMDKAELVKLMKGYDALVYAVGPDDRVHAPLIEGKTAWESAHEFFYTRLVTSVVKVFEAAREAGVKKAVLLNSYFAYFDRAFPERRLAEKNPYIKVRVEQSEALIKTGGGIANGGMDVSILELPYIFGNMPERMPLWKEVFLDRFAKYPAIFFPKGGTAMIHCTGVAESVVAATFYGKHATRYPIGNKNLKYKYMINTMMEACGATKRFFGISAFSATLGVKLTEIRKMKKEKQCAGLDYSRLMKDIQSKDYYIPDEITKQVREELHYKELGYNGGDSIEDGILKTMIACYPHRFKDGKLLDKWKGINPTKNEPKDNDPDLKKKK